MPPPGYEDGEEEEAALFVFWGVRVEHSVLLHLGCFGLWPMQKDDLQQSEKE